MDIITLNELKIEEQLRSINGRLLTYDSRMEVALEEIRTYYGATGERAKLKPKSLLKFGETLNADIDVETTVANFPGTVVNETYVSDNLIDTISSGNAGDNQTVTIEGHYFDSAGNKNFHVQNATLNGQSKVVLDQPLGRANRLYNADSSEFTGPIYVYQDQTISAGAPTDNTKVHLYLPAGNQQSEKCATAFSYNDFGILTGFVMSVQRDAGAEKLVNVWIEKRLNGGIFLPITPPLTLHTQNNHVLSHVFNPYHIVPGNADVKMIVSSNTNDTICTGGMEFYIATLY